MLDNTITLIAVSIFYSCGIFASCGVMILSAVNHQHRLTPYMVCSVALFASTVGLAVALKMQGVF